MRRIVAAAVLALSACAGGETNPGVEGELDVALSCQLKSCICASKTSAVFFAAETTPVRWRRNGDAYCDDGFELRFGEAKKRR